MASMSAKDIFDSLTPEEKEQVAHDLKLRKPQTACEKGGHKYKAVLTIPRFFLPPKTKFICEKCGEVTIV